MRGFTETRRVKINGQMATLSPMDPVCLRVTGVLQLSFDEAQEMTEVLVVSSNSQATQCID